MRATVISLALGVIAAAYAVMVTANKREIDTRVDSDRQVARPARVETERASTSRSTSVAASLSGTDPDGDLTVTVSRGTIRFFDYYLTTLGETDLAGVRALVAAEVARRSPDNATDVLALFDRYTAYLADLRDVRASTTDGYFEQTRALQQRHFGADAETLFGDDNALAARLLASRVNAQRAPR